jgi:hypothetical protein
MKNPKNTTNASWKYECFAKDLNQIKSIFESGKSIRSDKSRKADKIM